MTQIHRTRSATLAISLSLLLSIQFTACMNSSPASIVAETPVATTVSATIPVPVETVQAPPLATPTEAALIAHPSVTPEPPPEPEALPIPPAALSLPLSPDLMPNIAWGVEGTGSLVVWVGMLQEKPTPEVANPQPAVRWDQPLRLLDMEASPDRRSLAMLVQESEPLAVHGDLPTFLFVLDLASGQVRSLPNYAQTSLYSQSFYSPASRIIGWVDEDRIAVQTQNTPGAPVIASDDGLSYSRLPFPPEYSSALATTLSPDRTTFFSFVVGENGGYWLYGTTGDNPRMVVPAKDAKPLIDSGWSPDGRHIALLVDGAGDKPPASPSVISLWILDMATNSQHVVGTGDNWDVAPAWSPDGTRLAFLRAYGPVSGPKAAPNSPESVNTSVFVLDVGSPAPASIPGLSPQRNHALQWTPRNNILISSAASSASDASVLVVISPTGSSASQLIRAAPGKLFSGIATFR